MNEDKFFTISDLFTADLHELLVGTEHIALRNF